MQRRGRNASVAVPYATRSMHVWRARTARVAIFGSVPPRRSSAIVTKSAGRFPAGAAVRAPVVRAHSAVALPSHVGRLPGAAPGAAVPERAARSQAGGPQGAVPREGAVHWRVALRLPRLLAVRARPGLRRGAAGAASGGTIRGCRPDAGAPRRAAGCRCMASTPPAAQIRCIGRASSWRPTVGRAWSSVFRQSSPLDSSCSCSRAPRSSKWTTT